MIDQTPETHTLPPPLVQPLKPLTMPLSGLQLIEASAGTGKTWTLAALYVRLVLGHGRAGGPLLPPQILVMTFTEAATAELRGRIRERLAQAAAVFRGSEAGDAFLQQLKAAFAEAEWPAHAWRLEQAAQWMDDAAIFTIHGWSSRMLRQHAFDSASLFEQAKVEDASGMRLLAVRDYWREWVYPMSDEQSQAFTRLAATPEALLKKIEVLQRQTERSPDQATAEPLTPEQALADWTAWQARVQALEEQARQCWRTHREALRAQLMAAMAKDLNGSSYKAAEHANYLAQLDSWAEGGERDVKNIERFSLDLLIHRTKKQGTPPQDHFGLFALLQALRDLIAAEPDAEPALLEHATLVVRQRYEQHKAQLAQFDFSDLLQRLYHALQAGDDRLASAIRRQYPVALVDEFQDTDPWQYGALDRIYGAASEVDGRIALVMIGDPKQAIYSFRGADLNTYLFARRRVQQIHTLDANFRSTEALIRAVNHVFGLAVQPFGEVPFQPVRAGSDEVLPLKLGDQQTQPALTVWLESPDEPLTQEPAQQRLSAICATQMVALLNDGCAKPGEMAVLVRDWKEAQAVRRALAQRGVRSVYLSERDSVYESTEASDLWHILRAVAQPRSARLLRTALATRTWGLSMAALEQLIQSEPAWDQQVDHFSQWHLVWQRQGVLPMLHQLLHSQQLPARLLSQGDDGERRLTNVLHLGDLLQQASQGLQGEQALLHFLEAQLAQPQLGGDAAQLRLETDAELVQVVTMHKSKGLQYPLVFMPFALSGRKPKKEELDELPARLAEDVRLLYVAMTRAERALWLGVAPREGDLTGKEPRVITALSQVLGRSTPHDLSERLQTWAECPDIQLRPAPAPNAERFKPVASSAEPQAALVPRRQLASHWWQASFSALTRDLGPTAASPGATGVAPGSSDDERFEDAQTDNRLVREAQQGEGGPRFNAFAAGSRWGTLLHDLLEWQFEHGWPLAHSNAAPAVHARWTQMLELRARQLPLDAAQLELLQHWLRELLSTPLPLTGANEPQPLLLGQVQRDAAWAEMSFTLPARELPAERLDHLIRQHTFASVPRAALQPRTLSGMLTGFIDMVLLHQGRYYVLDYKSNRLPAYGPGELQAALLEHRYEVQYTLYLLALHRLLKARLPDYDYERHVGGAIYVFLRGVDQHGAGVFAQRPPRALIEALDLAMAGQTLEGQS